MSTTTDFVETPLGIFTTNGNWFYTNTEQIQQFAPGLLKYVEIDRIVADSEVWVRSTDSFALLVFLGLLLIVPSPFAVLFSIAALFLWQLSKSAFIGGITTHLVRVLSYDPVVLLISVVCLSYLGIIENYQGVGIGLLFFFIYRFGWLRKAFDTYYEKYHSGITLNDRVAKMVILRYAMKHNVKVNEVQAMETHILELMRKKKGDTSKKRNG
jgi:hypothetical protein